MILWYNITMKTITLIVIIAIIGIAGYFIYQYYHFHLSPTEIVRTDESMTLNNNGLSIEIAPPPVDRSLENNITITVKKVPVNSEKIIVLLSKHELHASLDVQKADSIVMQELIPSDGQYVTINISNVSSGEYNLGAVAKPKAANIFKTWMSVAQIQGLIKK